MTPKVVDSGRDEEREEANFVLDCLLQDIENRTFGLSFLRLLVPDIKYTLFAAAKVASQLQRNNQTRAVAVHSKLSTLNDESQMLAEEMSEHSIQVFSAMSSPKREVRQSGFH